MGWYKEMLQDMADIQAEDNRQKFWIIVGAIPGILGAGGLCKAISGFLQGEYLGSLAGLAAFVVMLLPMFICGAKVVGGLGGGITGIIMCLICTGFMCYFNAKNEDEKKAEANFETLMSQLDSFEGRKVKDCVGYWKGENAYSLHVSKKGKSYTIRAIDGKDEKFNSSATTEEQYICNTKSPSTCYTVDELICLDYYCMIAKGDSAYYFKKTAPYKLLGYARINKNEFDKEAKGISESPSK